MKQNKSIIYVLVSTILVLLAYIAGKKIGQEKFDKSLKDQAEKRPVHCITKNGIRLVIKREDFESGLKQPIGFM